MHAEVKDERDGWCVEETPIDDGDQEIQIGCHTEEEPVCFVADVESFLNTERKHMFTE